jgi:predicted O-linked N-acetylglucosamine transferase (SPINDLY family)
VIIIINIHYYLQPAALARSHSYSSGRNIKRDADSLLNVMRQQTAAPCSATLQHNPKHHTYTVLQVSRLCVADLSVDSLVYNGMTTACDSLWANVPLVSTPGHTMCVVRSSINSIDA